MKRREVIAGIAGGLLAYSFGARAQTPRPTGKIGYLHPRTAALDSPTVRVLRTAWETLGYVEPDTVLLRSAEDDPQRLPNLAVELVNRGAGVLIAGRT